MGLIQIDSVNVLVRSQELPLFARLGPHPRTLIDDATRDGELFEYWVHEAAHVPVELHPLMRWRMQTIHEWGSVERLQHRRPGLLEHVLERVRSDGPIVAGDLEQRRGPKGTWWDWDDGKLALELLFQQGRLAAVRRPNDFARRLRPRRARDPRGGPRAADTDRGRRPQGAARARRSSSRRRHVRGPHRLPPSTQPAVPTADPRAGRGGSADRDDRRGLGRSRRISTPTPCGRAGSPHGHC